MYDYSKLRGKIAEVCGTQESFAAVLNMNRSTLSAKLNNLSEFTQGEMVSSSVALGFPLVDIPIYFFTTEVGKTEQEAVQ